MAVMQTQSLERRIEVLRDMATFVFSDFLFAPPELMVETYDAYMRIKIEYEEVRDRLARSQA